MAASEMFRVSRALYNLEDVDEEVLLPVLVFHDNMIHFRTEGICTGLELIGLEYDDIVTISVCDRIMLAWSMFALV